MRTRWSVALVLLAIGVVGALALSSADAARAYRQDRGYYGSGIPQGTTLEVRLDSKISTDDVHSGDSWTGTVNQPVSAGGRVMIPAGSPVRGVVTHTAEGTHTTHASLGLAVREVQVNGETRMLRADTEPIVAGTHRAKKIGAIAGGAAAGALLGHAVGGEKGTLIGGVLGGAAGYGATRHAFRTLVLKPGTVLQFTTREYVASR